MLGLSTFAEKLENRRVVIFSDNKGKDSHITDCIAAPIRICLCSGAEHSTDKGSARAFDHNQLVHQIWTHAFAQKLQLWVERVPTKDNIADCPSRSDYLLMIAMRAAFCEPVLAREYLVDHMS